MDYPHSVAGVNLHNGKFTDGDPGTGIPSSLDPAEWANDVTDSILYIQNRAGLTPAENDVTQLSDALDILYAPASGYAELEFEADNYQLQTSDFGGIIELAGTTPANKTITVIDGTRNGDKVAFVNQSNFILTLHILGSSAANFIGVGVPLSTSFQIPIGGNAEIVWGGVNWRVNNFSGAYVPAAQGGSLRGINFEAGNYTTVDDDVGKMVQMAATATGNATFKIKDGTFVGATVKLTNQSNFIQTITTPSASVAQFLGPGVPLGPSFNIGPGGEATIIWGGVNWRVSAFSGNFSASGTLTATSGYEIHADGTIEQWGTGTLSGGTATVTFPITFPNGAYRASFIANTTATAVTAAGPTCAQTNSVTATGGTVWGASGATNTFTYRVKGN